MPTHLAPCLRPVIALSLLLAVGSVARAEPTASSSGAVDDARLGNAPEGASDWIAHGRTWSEQRYSPLAG